MSGATATRTPRRGYPFAATLLTLVMVPILLALSYWQFAIRLPWKTALIAQLEAAQSLPPVTAQDYFHAMLGEADLQYRHAEVDCRPGRVTPYDTKGGTSAAGGADGGTGGFLILVDCKGAAPHRPPDLVVVAGWTLRPDKIATIDVDTRFTGTLIEHPYGQEPGRPQFMLIPTTAVAPLAPSRIPTPGDLPDNHLSYALQWLAFAVTLVAVYFVYLRQWRRG
jgi:surfeit locus 1 family protein